MISKAARFGALISTAAMTAMLGLAGQAQAASASADAAQAIEYIAGKDVTVGSCKGWMNRNTSNGEVQALGQSWNNNECVVFLQRKRLGSGGYDWKQITHSYFLLNSTAATGFHWNGTNAGSRVCIMNSTTGGADCGDGAW